MNTVCLPGLLRKVFPDLLCREGEDGSHEAGQAFQDLVEGGLRRFPALRAGRKGVQPVLEESKIEGTHLHRTKILNAMVNRVELKMFVSLANPGNEFLKLVECPSVHLMEIMTGNPFFLGIEVVQIS